MTISRPHHLSDSSLPMPSQYLKWYGRFWDVVSLLAFCFATVSVITARPDPLTWREMTAAGLCIAQGVLYFFAIARGEPPFSHFREALYFGGGISLWMLAVWLHPPLWWLGYIYYGQMFGLLPLRAVIPGTALLTVLVALGSFEWKVSGFPVAAVAGYAFQWMFGMVFYLFIYAIIRTSRERANLITRLETAQKELEHSRQRDTELLLLQERERFARDLHDSLGHTLVTLSVQLEATQRLYKVDPDHASMQMDELKKLTRASMEELRRSLAGLRAPGLGERNLSDALQVLSVDVGQRAHIEMTCLVEGNVDQLALVLAETIWRVAQESLANIERHAAARSAQLQLKVQPNSVVLIIQDDGLGLPPDAEQQPGHYGLRGMRERVEGLGGSLFISNHGQTGTQVKVTLPIP